jgi:hypothetical protein
MMQTRKGSVKGGEVSGNLLGKRAPKPKSLFSPSSSSGASGSGNKKAKKDHEPTAKKAILQKNAPTEVGSADQQAEASSSADNGSSVAGASSSSRWDELTLSTRARFATLVGESEGLFPTDGSTKKLPHLKAAMDAAKAWFNTMPTEEALSILYASDGGAGADRKDEGAASKQPSVRGETSRTSSSVEVVGESQIAPPLIPSMHGGSDMFREMAALVAAEADQAGMGGAGRSKVSPEGDKPEGVGKYLGAWDTENPDLREIMGAIRTGPRGKLDAALDDHMGRSSLKLDKLSSAQRTEYGVYKVTEAYLALICEDMEALEEVFAEASLGSEEVARFIREKIAGSPADPAYWKSAKTGGKLTAHILGHQLRLFVERECPAGTWSRMVSKVSDMPVMSAFGAKECEEAKKQALKEAKPSPSQPKAGPARAGAAKGAGGSRSSWTPASAKKGSKDECHACKSPGHKAYEGKCAEGRKWIAAKKAAGDWRDKH